MKFEKLNGYKVFAPNKDDLTDFTNIKNKILIAMNANKILHESDGLKKIVNSNLSYPDGFGAVLCLKQRKVDAIKIPGCELWINIIKKNPTKKYFFIGSSEIVIQKVIQKLKNEFPNINISGYRNGYFENINQINQIKKKLKKLKPDMTFVAMGSPKQEFFMNELKKVHNSTYMGLGGSFDIYSGLKTRAPKLFIYLKLEWIYRLITEPKRIRRQLYLFKFLFYFLTGRFSR